MTTEAGRRLLDDEWPSPTDRADPTEEWVADAWALRNEMEARILAIEAEARAALLAELEAGVEGLQGPHPIKGWDEALAAVLDLIRKAGMR